jgi:hypothetical protein
MSDATREALLDLLAYCTGQVARRQELLDRWKNRPNVDECQVRTTTAMRERWKRGREALLETLGGSKGD